MILQTIVVSLLFSTVLAYPQVPLPDQGFEKVALQEVLEELMAEKQQDMTDGLAFTNEDKDGDLIDDKKQSKNELPKFDTQISTDLIANEMELDAEEQGRRRSGGVTYTRLGNDKCPGRSELVYYGVVAGSFYSQRGGGSNYLCLPHEPEYSNKYRGGYQQYSVLYGTEYEIPLRGEVHDHNIPCAVCYTPRRSSTVMIPALVNCPKSYTKEYEGYLMSAYRGHFRTEFVCVDKEMDTARGTHKNTNGALMYHVEVNCNSGIDCFPYRKDRELSCVVCSR